MSAYQSQGDYPVARQRFGPAVASAGAVAVVADTAAEADASSAAKAGAAAISAAARNADKRDLINMMSPIFENMFGYRNDGGLEWR